MRLTPLAARKAGAALASRVTSAAIDRDERKGKGASDHVPVIVEVD